MLPFESEAFAKFCGGYSALEALASLRFFLSCFCFRYAKGGQTIWAIRAMTGDPAPLDSDSFGHENGN